MAGAKTHEDNPHAHACGGNASDASSVPGDDLCADDVIQAYRWLLGREPESVAAIEGKLAHAKRKTVLRRRMLQSPEFKQKFNAIAGPAPDTPARYLPPECERIVFIHIPKTGGTTLRTLLSEAVGKDQVSTEGHNGLWRRTGAELCAARLFSGHYDRRCLSVIPGRHLRIVTMLREPRQRLLSVYQYLRSHAPLVVAANNLELAAAARRLAFGDFLHAALEINPATVDNTYLRTFGASLPYARWEQRAEPAARQSLADLGMPLDELVRQASVFLQEMAAVGILEEFDRSLAVIFAACELAAPAGYAVKQRLADLVAQNPAFEPVGEIAITADAERLIAELTRFDQELYQLGMRILLRSDARHERGATRSSETKSGDVR